MADSTSELISRSLLVSRSSSSIKWRIISLSETAGDIIFGLLLSRLVEDYPGCIEFDELAEKEKACIIGDASGLLHVMRDDHDGTVFLQLEWKLLDFPRGNRIERRTRSVHAESVTGHRPLASHAER